MKITLFLLVRESIPSHPIRFAKPKNFDNFNITPKQWKKIIKNYLPNFL